MTTPTTAPPRVLTDADLHVLRLLAAGYTNDAISQAFNVQPHTGRTYAERVMSKLGASNRAHAVHIGYQRGFLTVERPQPEGLLLALADLLGVTAHVTPAAEAGS
jgi:DNA-binding CsgD family transcriptional regulator